MTDREDAAQPPVSAPSPPASGAEHGLPHSAAAALAALILCVAVWAVYGRILHQPFIFDDRGSVLENTSIMKLRPLIGEDSPLNSRNEIIGRRPLANLSLAINYRFGQLDPWGYHLFSIVVHVFTSLLLWELMSQTLRLRFFGKQLAQVADPLALLVALVWALHPLLSECVAYVTQRTELLVGFFYLATLYSSLRYWEAKSRGRRATWLGLATLCCLLGVGSKEVIVTAPVMVLLFERTFVAGSFRRALRESWPLYLGLAVSWAWLVALGIYGPRYGTAGFGRGVPVFAYWSTQAKVLLLYLKLSFWPWPLVIHYDIPLLKTLGAALLWVLPVAALGIATLVLIARRTAAGFVGAWLFVILSPTLVIPMSDEIAAERRMYLPLAAIVALVVVGGYQIAARAVRNFSPEANRSAPDGWPLALTAAVAIGVVMIFGIVSVRRLAVYNDALTLWQDALLNQPDDPVIRANLGAALNNAGRPQEAVEHLKEAVRLKPGFASIHYRLGIALVQAGRLPEAIEQFETAVRLDPGSPEYHHVLGSVLVNSGSAEKAIEQFNEVLRINPNSAETRQYLGTALLSANRPKEAIEQFEQALRLSPESVAVLRNLAFALVKAGHTQAGFKRYEESLSIGPDSPQDRFLLAKVLESVGKSEDAIIEFKNALRMAPDAAQIHYELGLALDAAEQQPEAIEQFNIVQRLRPDDVDARIQLATAYGKLGKTSDAIAAAEQALILAQRQGQPALVKKLEAMLTDFRLRPATP